MIAKKQLQAQVVPIEPRRYSTWDSFFQGLGNFFCVVPLLISLGSLYTHFSLTLSLILICLYIIIGYSGSSFLILDTPSTHSVYSKQRKELDERRQQAATSTLKNPKTVFVDLAPANLLAPLDISLSMRRGRRATYIRASIATFAILLNLVYCWGLLIYSSMAYPWTIVNTIYTAFLLLMFYRFIVKSLLLTPHQQLRASEHGLLCQHGYQSSYIPWSDAKLLAIVGGRDTKSSPLLYELSGSKTVIRWGATPSRNLNMSSYLASPVGFTNLGIAKPEQSSQHYQQQAQLLLSIIADKTSLTLYDLRDPKKR